ncbi:MAG TPA: hypothetical protein VFC58_08560 [Desulfosporosinus sp.]|nr:hypothetical protein [Desulfosporosinus sp.]
MDDIERNSLVPSVQPILRIGARQSNRERRELTYLYKRNQQGRRIKPKKLVLEQPEHQAAEPSTPEEVKQDLLNYKSDLKIRLTFDRAQLLDEEPSSNL